jgi:hypothetical protein
MAFPNNGTISGFGPINTDLANNNVIDVSGGVREINGTLSSTAVNGGTILIESTGTLQLDKAASGNTVTFKAATGVLEILQIGNIQNTFTIASISAGDKILLPNAPAGFTLHYNTNTGTLAINNGVTNIGNLVFTKTASLATAGFFNNIVLQCFASGTRIATPDGARTVDMLRVGDQVRLHDGEAGTIEWVGHRHVDCERHPAPEKVLPFRIAAHTFGRGKPDRDLLLSPDHAVFVDGVLIPVKYLANGTTIRQVVVAEVTYHHFELRHHAIVEAENLTVETLLPGSDKTAFAGSAVTALHPDFVPRNWESHGCAPLIVTGPRLETIRRRINGHESDTISGRRRAGAKLSACR